jgi:hypothetical protein
MVEKGGRAAVADLRAGFVAGVFEFYCGSAFFTGCA